MTQLSRRLWAAGAGNRHRRLLRALLIASVLALPTVGLPSTPALAAGCHATYAEELSFRRRMGFSTYPDLIRSVLADPTPNCDWGFPMTDAGAAEINRRSQVANEITALNEYILHRSDLFGGLYIDNPAGGIVVVLTTPATPDSALSAAEALIPADAEYQVHEVKYSRRELVRLMPQIMKAADGAVNGVGLDEQNNRLSVSIYPDRFDETRALLLATFPDDILSFESSDGGHDTGGGPPPTDALPGSLAPATLGAGPLFLTGLFAIAFILGLRVRRKSV